MMARLHDFYRHHPLWTLGLVGLASALGFAPVFFFPATMLGFSLLFLSLSQASLSYKQVFARSWMFFFAYLAGGLYWIGLSLHVDWVKFGWLFPFAALGLPAFIGLFNGVGGLVFKGLSRGSRDFTAFLMCALCFSAVEYVRGHVLTGFAWQLTGDIWFFSDTLPQIFALGGAYGVSLITTLLLMLPGYMYGQWGSGKGVTKSFLIIGFALVGAHYYGKLQLQNSPRLFHNHFDVMLVQPNIPQKLKWQPELFEEHIHHLMTLSHKGQSERQKMIIWPEAASPFAIDGPGKLPTYLSKILKPQDILVTGAPRYSYAGPDKQLHNSLVAIGAGGNILSHYDKVHLVPFGEYVPGRAFLPEDVAKVSAGSTDFIAGPKHETLKLRDFPSFSPLICYEIVFPAAVIDDAQRPEWLLNLTNDAWYLNSSGPYQHFHMARARAIEEGLPVVRVANTGISAVIDGRGRVLTQLNFGQEGVISSLLPKAQAPTLYALYRDWIYFSVFAMIAFLGLICRFFKRVYPCRPSPKIA